MVYPILQRSLRMGKSLRTTPESHILADVVSSLFTPLAGLTRQSHFQRNFVSNFEVLHI